MANQFDFLPNYGVLFIDSSSVSRRNPEEDPFLKIDNELERLICLVPRLSELENLRTIPEVLKEYRVRIVDAKRAIKRTGKYTSERYEDYCSTISRIYRQRKEVFRLLSKGVAAFESEKTPDLERAVTMLKSQTELFFCQSDGRANENDTNTKLLTAALAYAYSKKNFVSIWTFNKAIARTFVGISKRLELENTGIIYEDSPLIPCHKNHKAI